MGRRSRSRSPAPTTRARRERERSPPPPSRRYNRRKRSRERPSSRERDRRRGGAAQSSSRDDARRYSRSRSRSRSRSPMVTRPARANAAERPEVSEVELQGKSPDEQEMMKMMGFCAFDTTKNKKVEGNDVGNVHVILKRKYRQYMNRKGGFNRPLDFVA